MKKELQVSDSGEETENKMMQTKIFGVDLSQPNFSNLNVISGNEVLEESFESESFEEVANQILSEDLVKEIRASYSNN